MAVLAKFQTFALDDAGNVLPFPTVEVIDEATSLHAVLFSDRAGASGISNPFLGDSEGLIAFHVQGGAYKIIVTSGSIVRTLRYVGIGTANEQDLPAGFDASDLLTGAGNLSGLSNTATARTNLGISTVGHTGVYADLTSKPTLGTAAALNVGTGANNVVQLNGSSQLPAVSGALLTNLNAAPIPTSSTLPVGHSCMCNITTITNVTDGNTISGASLAQMVMSLQTISGCPSIQAMQPTNGNTQSGTWKNISGITLGGPGTGNAPTGQFVRTA